MNDRLCELELFLRPTPSVDSDSPLVRDKALELIQGVDSERERGVRLFYFARDAIRYNPFAPMFCAEEYAASATLQRGSGYCVQKAVLLAALCRAAKIPTRLCFADLLNHCVPGDLLELMGTNLFTYHGYCELYLEGRWVKATPAFDSAMCQRHGFRPVEFDGSCDAVFHSTTLDGRPHIEYVRDIGRYHDLPLNDLIQAFIETYGKANPDLMEQWRGK
ncbi:MAG: transglutaminase family protein [Candidatus Alcyoniella australis]|nr:transglutaminase family protein [Candidatus Alcyoniella australis]